MKLPREFIRLPLSFDAEKLATEVRSLPAEAWQSHPTGFKGNSATPLISVNGGANDYFSGPMAETPWLKQSPYLRQVLASFQVVCGRSRLMALAGGSEVPMHVDANYQWFTRVRIHVPVITFPEVQFYCGDKCINMRAGEAWIFDNWRTHRVVNGSTNLRVHLVVDTVGSSAFWGMVEQSLAAGEAQTEIRNVGFDPALTPNLNTERVNTLDVMHPGEMELLTEDLVMDLLAAGKNNDPGLVKSFVEVVRSFCQDWKSLWAAFGADQSAWPAYAKRRDRILDQLLAIRRPLVLDSNGAVAQKVMRARVLVACVNSPLPGLNEIQFAP